MAVGVKLDGGHRSYSVRPFPVTRLYSEAHLDALTACYDEETGAYTAVTKCLSGFTDAFYKTMREKYSPDAENPLTSHECWPEVEAGSLTPDIWFKPTEVWEIRGAE